MEKRLALMAVAELPGVRVTELCKELGISRASYYRLRERLEAEGAEGLAPRSRRPHRSPNQISPELEDEIVRLRKELPLDNGAEVIGYHLARAGWEVPHVRTIHRVLVRRGQVVPQPHKAPKAAYRRFEYDAPNGCWQIDATLWRLARGVPIWIMDLLDDHSRVALAARVGAGPTTLLAWESFLAAAGHWGLPARVLSDNGTCFAGGPGSEGGFAPNLRALGVQPIRSSPAHPQTCGKLERFHQTLKKWLRLRSLARTAEEPQAQLDEFLAFYNYERPHKACGGGTPAERFSATPPDVPHTEPIAEPDPEPALHSAATR